MADATAWSVQLARTPGGAEAGTRLGRRQGLPPFLEKHRALQTVKQGVSGRTIH